ncbi:MAG TPA: zinc ribbon domain-containing protein [Calditrichia bacterium]|nr:zinc ribbon domain-containing protein [Calditrichota bacterium]HQU72931.1 zinc ribbon domain-containing protein [Calditrichia bacterium]HQV31898.1 zinc ribbon domain-containing protein [Calditrichia bacterium]
MPTYEYKCQNCNHRLDAFQSMSADPLTECPECQQPTLKRLISGGAGLIFKGTGFYQTDYKSGSSGSAPEKNSCSTDGGGCGCN